MSGDELQLITSDSDLRQGCDVGCGWVGSLAVSAREDRPVLLGRRESLAELSCCCNQ